MIELKSKRDARLLLPETADISSFSHTAVEHTARGASIFSHFDRRVNGFGPVVSPLHLL